MGPSITKLFNQTENIIIYIFSLEEILFRSVSDTFRFMYSFIFTVQCTSMNIGQKAVSMYNLTSNVVDTCQNLERSKKYPIHWKPQNRRFFHLFSIQLKLHSASVRFRKPNISTHLDDHRKSPFRKKKMRNENNVWHKHGYLHSNWSNVAFPVNLIEFAFLFDYRMKKKNCVFTNCRATGQQHISSIKPKWYKSSNGCFSLARASIISQPQWFEYARLFVSVVCVQICQPNIRKYPTILDSQLAWPYPFDSLKICTHRYSILSPGGAFSSNEDIVRVYPQRTSVLFTVEFKERSNTIYILHQTVQRSLLLCNNIRTGTRVYIYRATQKKKSVKIFNIDCKWKNYKHNKKRCDAEREWDFRLSH